MTAKKQPLRDKPPKPRKGEFSEQPLNPLRDSRPSPPSIRDTHPRPDDPPPDNKPVKK